MTFDPSGSAHLTTGEAHAPLAHAVGTGEVELDGVGSSRFGGLADLAPVLLRVATYDTGYHNLGGREGGREREREREGGREGVREEGEVWRKEIGREGGREGRRDGEGGRKEK